MKKNCKIHLWMETELKENLEKQAKESNISLCELCRQKLRDNSRLTEIEIFVDKVLSKIESRKIYKQDGLVYSANRIH